jgi:uncharacterized membrane protein YgdD (TMEM256/DUF423 family)
MRSQSRRVLVAAGLLLALATLLGAYGSHGLDARADPAALAAFRTAIDYQFYQALGLLGLGALLDRTPPIRGLGACAALLLVGVLLFAGGIVLPILGSPAWIGYPVPLGGLLIVAAWLGFVWIVWRAER